jgi:hypothetical protein
MLDVEKLTNSELLILYEGLIDLYYQSQIGEFGKEEQEAIQRSKDECKHEIIKRGINIKE